MKPYIVTKTNITPQINLDPDSGSMVFEGRSIPEDPVEFYEPVIDWMLSYFKNPPNPALVEFKLEYVNSGSSKFILSIFKTLQQMCDAGNSVSVKWYYEEDDEVLLELGSHFKNTFTLPFELVETY